MSDRRTSHAHKMSMNKIRGQPNSSSMPAFRFNVGDNDLKEVEPEIEEVFEQDDNYSKQRPSLGGITTSTSAYQRIGELPVTKDGHRSASFECSGSPSGIGDADSKSLFSELKDSVRDKFAKTARNLEEKIGREIPGSVAVLGRRIGNKSDARGLETLSEDDHVDFENSLSSLKLDKSSQDHHSGSSNSPEKDEPKKSSPMSQSTTAKNESTDDKSSEMISHPENTSSTTESSILMSGNVVGSSVVHRRKHSSGSGKNETNVSMSSLISPRNNSMEEGEELTEGWEIIYAPGVSSDPQLESPDKAADETPSISNDVNRWTLAHLQQALPSFQRINLILWSVIFLVYFVLPFPSFISGFMIGIMLAVILGPIIAPYLPEPPNIYSLETGYWEDPSVPDLDSAKGELHKVCILIFYFLWLCLLICI